MLALAVLREFGRPAAADEFARAMLQARGAAADAGLRERIASRVAAVFAHNAEAGQVRRVRTDGGRQVLWEIAR